MAKQITSTSPFTLALILSSVIFGCSEDTTSVGDTDDEETGEETSNDTTDDPTDVPGDDPELPSDDWCERVVAGPAGSDVSLEGELLEFALAHADIRLFGVEGSYAAADAGLIAALADPEQLRVDLSAYDATLNSVCALEASSTKLGEVQTELIGDMAWVRPGLGEVELPAGAAALVLDLRDLPNVPELRAALEAAVSPALAAPIARPTRRVRVHDGHTDQIASPNNVYSTTLEDLEQDPIPASGSEELPIVLLTGTRMAPEVAEFAGTLRLGLRAWLVGQDVFADIAESRWAPVGSQGLIWRQTYLSPSGKSYFWPHRIHADRPSVQPELELDTAADWSVQVVGLGFDVGERPPIGELDPYAEQTSFELGYGELRASLMVAHGIIKRFYPYFEIVGDTTDATLLELLDWIDDSVVGDHQAMHELIRRYAHELRDGHGFTANYHGQAQTGRMAAIFEHVGGYPVVRRTTHPGLSAGDTVLSIDGVPALDWYAQQAELVSAASLGYELDLVARSLTRFSGTRELLIEDPEGTQSNIVLSPADPASLDALGDDPWTREAGWLDDLDAPGLYYINMSSESEDAVFEGIDEAIAGDAQGMVVDMRGYPTLDHYAVAERLIPGSFSSPLFRVARYRGVEELEDSESRYWLTGDDAYEGPLVLLVGNHCVSAAENFSIMLVGAERGLVVGQPSAATNGNISGINLPGGFGLMFTGMEVLYPDEGVFHGTGIQPDIHVNFDPADFRDGIDPELMVAIETLGGG